MIFKRITDTVGATGGRAHRAGRIGAFVATVGVSAALVGAAAHATGAYFSDTQSGTISGTLGSIKVTTAGADGASHLDFSFDNMLPGERQTKTVSYQNTGRNSQDVYVVFNNADALHALNVLGTYGEVHLASGGTEIFASTNLNDDTVSCPPGAFDATHGPCNALPRVVKLASNLGPTASGTFSFSFNYASKLGNGANIDGTTGPAWNCYPVVGPNSTAACDPTASNHYGLPYQIVATQVGVAPGA